MPRITVKVGGREPLTATIVKATPMGALGTDAIVRLGPLELTGPAPAMRALADACEQVADLADAYDQDPDAYNEREQDQQG